MYWSSVYFIFVLERISIGFLWTYTEKENEWVWRKCLNLNFRQLGFEMKLVPLGKLLEGQLKLYET